MGFGRGCFAALVTPTKEGCLIVQEFGQGYLAEPESAPTKEGRLVEELGWWVEPHSVGSWAED